MTTLHILPNPYGITNPKYRMDPFNIAVIKFINNMKDKGYEIVHYGHESSQVNCENVIATTKRDLEPPGDEHMFLSDETIKAAFTKRADREIARRKRPGDMILCFYGWANQAVADNHKELFIVEPSIGYSLEAVFAPYRAFTSYSQMHYYYGINKMMMTPSWNDAVIPNAFTPSEFEFCNEKEDYFVYLGRIIKNKGIDLAIQITRHLGKKLIIAGPGSLEHLNYKEIPSHVEMVGYVNAEQRKNLLKKAKALIAPTYYIEPFGNIVVEAQLCGTPVITTDWGGFVDNVVQGVTGYRCKDFKSFVEAASTIDSLDPQNCRTWAEQNFSDEVVHNQFDVWLQRIIRRNFYHV